MAIISKMIYIESVISKIPLVLLKIWESLSQNACGVAKTFTFPNNQG
jgi:hypothetical protein